MNKTFGDCIIEEACRQAVRDLFFRRLKVCALLLFIVSAIIYIYRNFP